MKTITKKVKCTLVGVDGNAFALMATFSDAAKREGWTPDEVQAVLVQAKSGDYDKLLRVLSEHCEGGGFASDDE